MNKEGNFFQKFGFFYFFFNILVRNGLYKILEISYCVLSDKEKRYYCNLDENWDKVSVFKEYCFKRVN